MITGGVLIMKKNYISAEIEVVYMSSADVVTLSVAQYSEKHEDMGTYDPIFGHKVS